MSDGAEIRCGTHGVRVAAVICGHMLETTDRALGFIENSADPDDLQAWCDDCEETFLRERSLTAAFRKFNDMRVVCDFCYASLKNKHSRP